MLFFCGAVLYCWQSKICFIYLTNENCLRGQVIPGQKKKSKDRRPVFVSRRLLEYGVPANLKMLALDIEASLSLLDTYPVLGEELKIENYAEKFKALIHLVSHLPLEDWCRWLVKGIGKGRLG